MRAENFLIAHASRDLPAFEGVSSDGDQSTRTWVAPDETVFVGRIGPAILWITGESRAVVGEALELVADALEPAPAVPTRQGGTPRP